MRTGSDQFEKQTFYGAAELGNISQILVGWPADREGASLTVVGNQNVHFLDGNGRLIKQIHFSRNFFCPIEVTRLDASGDYGYLTREESWSCPVVLLDGRGQERWSYSGGLLSGVDDSVSLDLQGDGPPEVVVGLNGGGGVVLLDSQGKRIWEKAEGNVWHVEGLDTNEDGRKEILHTDAQGQLLVRDARGDVIARYLPDTYVSHFALTRWGGEVEPTHILVPVKTESEILILDKEGKTVAQLEAPLENLMNGIQGTPVQFGRNAEYYAAVSYKPGLTPRSMLLLYTSEGRLVYREVFGAICRGVAALPAAEGERLLVGCSGDVFEYSSSNSKPR